MTETALRRAVIKMLHVRGNGGTDVAQARAAVWAALWAEDATIREAAARRMCVLDGVDPEAVDYKGAKAWREYDEAAGMAIVALQETIARQSGTNEPHGSDEASHEEKR